MNFMDDSFVNLGQYKAGCAQRLFLQKNRKRVNSDFAMTIWHFESATVSLFCYLLLTVQMRSYVRHVMCVCVCVCVWCVCVCVCVRERERETGSHHSGVSCLYRGLCANTYELHLCVCPTSPFPSRA